MTLLVLFFLIEFTIAFVISRGDFFRPSVIVSGLMFAASVCALYLSFIWKFELNLQSGSILALSVLVFVVIDFIVSRFYSTRPNAIPPVSIKVNKIVIYFITLFDCVVICYHFRFLKDNFGSFGSLSDMATMYRKYIVWGVLEANMSRVLTRAIRFMQNFSFILLFVFLNNILSGEKSRKNILLLMPVALYMADSILMGARGYIMYVIFAGLVYYYVLYQRKHGWQTKYSFRVVKKLIFTLFISAFGFVLMGNFVGRDSSNNMFYRLSRYFGGGIALFNDFIAGGGEASPGFGAVTFTDFYGFMHRRFGWTSYSDINQFEFRVYDGNNWGNVYTALRRYYQDFGYLGTIIMVLILVVFFSVYYQRIKKAKNNFISEFAFIYYGILSRSLFLFFFDDEFFNDFCTPSILIYLLEFLICLVIVDNRAKFKNGRIMNYERIQFPIT